MDLANFEGIEEKLGRSLRPIQPNHEFVFQLQKRLIPQKSIQVEKGNIRYAIISTILGMTIGIFLIWIFRRMT